jgi:hypothetical protein
MIVKIQRPIVSSEEVPKALVYNRGRKFEAFMPMTSDIEGLFGEGEYKVYHKVKVKRGIIFIGERVADQDF